jgi:hypothetical protein
MKAELRGGLATSDPEIPLTTRANGTLMPRLSFAGGVPTYSLSDCLGDPRPVVQPRSAAVSACPLVTAIDPG